MIYVLWQFKPRRGKREEFERVYASDGAWAKLFRHDPAYRETRLLRETQRKDVYLCMDIWNDLKSYEAFKQLHRADYDQLDRECEALTDEEIAIGIFEEL